MQYMQVDILQYLEYSQSMIKMICGTCKRQNWSAIQGKESYKSWGEVKEVEQADHNSDNTSESDGSINDKDTISNSDEVE